MTVGIKRTCICIRSESCCTNWWATLVKTVASLRTVLTTTCMCHASGCEPCSIAAVCAQWVMRRTGKTTVLLPALLCSHVQWCCYTLYGHLLLLPRTLHRKLVFPHGFTCALNTYNGIFWWFHFIIILQPRTCSFFLTLKNTRET